MDLVALREAVNAAITRMHEAAEAVSNLAADAAAEDIEAAERSLTDSESAVEAAKRAVERAERVERAKAEKPLEIDKSDDADKRHADAKGTLKSEPVYREDKGGFFMDLARSRAQDVPAIERLAANNREVADRAGEITQLEGWQQRAISTTANAGGQFVAPVWLLDLYAAKRRAGRAYLNALGTLPFHNDLGNSINVPTITTGSLTAFGTAENAAITNQDLVTSSVTAATQTVSGQTKASYQLIDLSQAGMDAIIMDDMTRDLTLQLDVFALNSTTTNAKGLYQVSGTNPITYTDATPTVPELYPFLFQAKSAVEKSVFAGVDFAVCHPSTWNWFLSALDGNNRPLALSTDQAAFNRVAGFDPTAAQGLAGNFNGIPVIVDPNVPTNLGGGTNEAWIGVVSRLAHMFWEGVPNFRVADQTGISSLQYVFAIWAYAAQMSRYAAGASIVKGTGLIVQSGF